MDDKYNPKAIAKTINIEDLYDLDVTIAIDSNCGATSWNTWR